MLRHVNLPDLGAPTLAALARLGARLVQAEAHPQGVDAWLVVREDAGDLSTLLRPSGIWTPTQVSA